MVTPKSSQGKKYLRTDTSEYYRVAVLAGADYDNSINNAEGAQGKKYLRAVTSEYYRVAIIAGADYDNSIDSVI